MRELDKKIRGFAQKAVTFDNHCVGSLPCILARRELHTDPQQTSSITGATIEISLVESMTTLMREADAPDEIFTRFGLTTTHGYYALQTQFKRLAIQTGEHGPIAQCIAGVDIALWDLVAKRLSLPLHKLLGSQSATIGAYASGLNPTDGVDTFLRCQDEGHTAFKLKIGFGDEIDYPNIEGICAKLKPDEQLMVDANPNPLRQRLYEPVVVNGQTTLSDKPGLGVDLEELAALQDEPSMIGAQ